MTIGHWQVIFLVAAFLFFLGMFALNGRQGGRLFRGVQRVLWACLGVWLAGEMGVIALNGATLMLTAIFGLPGALAAISLAHW